LAIADWRVGRRQKAEVESSSTQKAEAEGRKQKAESRRQKQKAEDAADIESGIGN